ncbi:TonB-dependent receptor [Mucilaginibacter sp. RS28]|uniref:TonB-dependent receptor n=1 Tax=Mucilaginibacter straminoryzae TaxID=2932774 RepID=A0A9X1X1V4_9SPHI|nr:TonB-dependent receptor [Mucilaginibacter straminoryzae]MCJ8209692.1 TonB-dependent receptor [Mucilaginibacter straminoryzae]
MNKNFIRVAASLGFAQLVLQAAAVHAQDTTRTLKDVVVTASRSPKKQSEIGRVVTTITAAEIARSQGKTLPELINTVPGIMYSGAQNMQGQSSDIYLRGASAGNTLILVDGFPVNDASSIAGNYDLNAFPVNEIDHIEILKGSGSTLYGSDAVAGVINIITKHATGQGLKATGQFVGGSYKTFQEAVGLNGKLNKTGIALNVSNTDSKGFSVATDKDLTGTFDNDSFHQRSISLNLSQPVSNNFVLRGNLQYSRNTGDNDYDAFVDDKDYTYKRTYLNGGLGATWTLQQGALNLNVSQNNVRNKFQNLPGDNFNTYQLTNNLGKITNAEAVFNYKFNQYLDITSGAGYKYSSSNQYGEYRTTGYTPKPSVLSADSAHTAIGSVYTSLFFSYDVFHLEVGGRYNNHNKYGSNFTYTINPSFYLFNRLKVFGTLATAFKAPSLYQLYSQYGNIDLKPEKTTGSYEAGLDLGIVKNVLSFNTVFYKRSIEDVIAFYTDPKTFASYYVNANRQNDKGFESELTFKLSNITASAYAAYVVGRQTDATGKDTRNLYRRPKNTYGATLGIQVTNQFSFGFNYKYTGDRRDNDFTVYPSQIITLKHYNLLDLHLQADPCPRLTIFADLKNILDENYFDWYGYNTRRFNAAAGVKYQFN